MSSCLDYQDPTLCGCFYNNNKLLSLTEVLLFIKFRLLIYLQVVLLECLHKEAMLPKDVLSHFNTAFAYAKQGRV